MKVFVFHGNKPNLQSEDIRKETAYILLEFLACVSIVQFMSFKKLDILGVLSKQFSFGVFRNEI